jgi:hypothetical protein
MTKLSDNLSIAVALSVFVSSFLIATVSAAGGGPIKVASEVPYDESSKIADNILEECTELGGKLGRFVNQYATKYDIPTEVVDEPDPAAGGRVLVVKITNAHSGGNAFVGHRKSMSATAELFEDGVSKGSKDFTRASGGGFGGGYKGSCSVLGRCTKALGKDIAVWLRDLK